jgi:hypothetical protein
VASLAAGVLLAVLGLAPLPADAASSPEPGLADPAPAEVHTDAAGSRATASLEEGFGVRSADGAFSFGIGFLGQLRYEATLDDDQEVSQGIALRLARPVLQARLWGERLQMRLMPEFAGGSPRLLDATATVTVHPAFAIQVGQFRPWLSRGFRTGLPVLTLPDRGRVVDEFRVDRDIGLTILGHPFGGRLEYYAGILDGDGPNAVNVDPRLLYTGRVVVAPLGPVGYTQAPYLEGHDELRAAVGVSAYTVAVGETQDVVDPTTGATTTVSLPDRRDVGASADVVVAGGRFSGQLEGFWRQQRRVGDPPDDAWGGYGQLSGLVVVDRLDLAVRAGGQIIAGEVTLPIEAGLSIYLAGQHAKLQFRYGCDASPHGFGCVRQLGTVQAQLSF